MKTRDNIKILLLQVRTDEMKEHEYACFLRYSGLKGNQLISKSAFDDDVSSEILQGFDGLIIGGSGQFSVLEEHLLQTNNKLKNIVKWCYLNSFPFLGACYGAHIATLALGGTVEAKEEYKETGTFLITLTKGAKDCLMFSHIPERFKAQLGHKDSIIDMPEGATLLAYSSRCPIQAFSFVSRNFYAIQFHPELDKEDLIRRVHYYQDYVEDNADLQKLIDEVKDTPEVARVPRLFVKNVVQPNKK